METQEYLSLSRKWALKGQLHSQPIRSRVVATRVRIDSLIAHKIILQVTVEKRISGGQLLLLWMRSIIHIGISIVESPSESFLRLNELGFQFLVGVTFRLVNMKAFQCAKFLATAKAAVGTIHCQLERTWERGVRSE